MKPPRSLLALAALVMCVSASPLFAQLALDTAQPPVAAKKPKDVTVHGDRRIDDYFWFRDKTNPELLNYLRAENAYTDAVLKPTKPLQEKLYQEMLSHVQEADTSAPVPDGKWAYLSRTEKGKQYRVIARRPRAEPNSPEQVLLDLNAFAAANKFVGLSDYEVSDDGNLLAYGLDLTGHRDYELFVKDLRTGQIVKQAVGTASSFQWAADNDTIFFTKEDPVSKRSYQLGRCVLSTGKIDTLYEEKDEIYDIGLSRSLDRKYLFCTAASKQTSEVRALPTSTPQGQWRVLIPRSGEHRYTVTHRDGLFYFVTNLEAKNYRIMTAPVGAPVEANWKECVPHNPAVRIERILLFANHAVIGEREGGLPYLRVIDLKTKSSHRITFPEPAYQASLAGNADYDTAEVRFSYESPVTPRSVFTYDMATRQRTLVKQDPVPGGFSAADYKCERVFCTASDGTQIPVTLVYRASLRTPGKPQPLFLYAYGSYGISQPDNFSSPRLSLLDRGVIYAIAHIRGGGELGEPWREAGRMQHKMTTFTDFIACSEDLIKQHYTTTPQLVISGGSAGGLLMGAVLNLRPNLFRAAIAKVPFVDVINTMLDATLPLTTAEYIEWGNPNLPDQYQWIRAYSPYDNIKPQVYPAILVTTALNDSQVPYWEGCKFVAKLRATKTDSNPLLLKISLDPAGHGGASGRYDALRDTAVDYAFTLAELGLPSS